jgi:hypothetical protein
LLKNRVAINGRLDIICGVVISDEKVRLTEGISQFTTLPEPPSQNKYRDRTYACMALARDDRCSNGPDDAIVFVVEANLGNDGVQSSREEE